MHRTEKKHVHVVDDDPAFLATLDRLLARQDYEVGVSQTGTAALDTIAVEPPDALLLDLLLPDIDGFEVCRRVRRVLPVLPILILTGRTSPRDELRGFDAGATDYLRKPVSARVLIARLAKALQTVDVLSHPEPADIGALITNDTAPPRDGLQICAISRRVFVDHREIHLTPKEFDVLVLLASEPGAVVSQRRLLRTVWNTDMAGASKTLHTHVGRLRRKLGRYLEIRAVRGVGFRLQTPETEVSPVRVVSLEGALVEGDTPLR